MRLTRRGEIVAYVSAGVIAAVLGFLSGPYCWVLAR